MGHAVTEETWVRVSEPGGNKAILLDFRCTPSRRPGRIFIFSGLIPAATVTLLHVRMTPTPVGKVVALLHVRENAAAPVGAGAWHGQKWSPEAKNELPAGSPRWAHRGWPNGAKQYHAITWNLSPLCSLIFTGFVSGAAPPKTVPGGRDSASRPSYGS